MPRKQRFKPSRKPKPMPMNEDAALGHPDGVQLSEKAPMREPAREPTEESTTESGSQSG